MEIAITDAELTLMRLLWQEHPLNARQITERLTPDKSWHRKTINTLLSRLEKKAVLSAHKHEDGIKYFTPAVKEAAYNQTATSHFVDRLFNGNIISLLLSFANEHPLTSEQIMELRSLLEVISGSD